MAGLRTKTFAVQVFVSGSLREYRPDITEEVVALDVTLAIQRVMGFGEVDEAGVVYVRSSDGGEAWFYEVSIVHNVLMYEHAV